MIKAGSVIDKFIKKIYSVSDGAYVDFSNKEAVRKLLTITSTGKEKFTLDLSQYHGNRLKIPRALVSGVLVETSPHWECDRILSKIQLRPEQNQIVGQYLNAINTYSPYGGIIQAKTGTGKTVIALHIASLINLRTLIIVPTEYLMTQWVKEIKKFTNAKDKDIGIIRQNTCDIRGKKFVVAMMHSLAMKHYPDIHNKFGLVVYDEIHRIPTLVFSRVAGMFHCKYTLGLSATPRRKDGMENVFFWHIGKVVASSEKANAKPRIIMLPYKGTDTHHKGCVWAGELSLGRYLNRLAKSKDRTLLLGNIIKKLYDKGEDILVLSDRIIILNNLKRLLSNNINPNDIGLFTSQKKQPDKKIILATYGSAELGANIPRLSALVFATPRVDIEQSVGRVLRVEGKIPTVVDIVDTSSKYMLRWGRGRLSRYKEMTDTIINKVD